MVDAFCGTWKLVNSENFDEYMKALGKFYYYKINNIVYYFWSFVFIMLVTLYNKVSFVNATYMHYIFYCIINLC